MPCDVRTGPTSSLWLGESECFGRASYLSAIHLFKQHTKLIEGDLTIFTEINALHNVRTQCLHIRFA